MLYQVLVSYLIIGCFHWVLSLAAGQSTGAAQPC